MSENEENRAAGPAKTGGSQEAGNQETEQGPAAGVRPKPRVALLDTLRGFSILSMVAYHTMFDLVYLFGVNAAWYGGWPGYLWQQSICWVFILVSGASLHYGKHTVRRGLIVFGCGCVVSLVTALAMPGETIWFGILHFMGLAMLLSVPLRPLLRKIAPLAGFLGSFALFLFTKALPFGSLGIADHALFRLPAALYSVPFLFPLGLPGPGFTSGDYFPLVPWFFLFVSGWFLWALLGDKLPRSYAAPGFFGTLGKHSLLIYMLHQPLIYGALLLLQALGVFS